MSIASDSPADKLVASIGKRVVQAWVFWVLWRIRWQQYAERGDFCGKGYSA